MRCWALVPLRSEPLLGVILDKIKTIAFSLKTLKSVNIYIDRTIANLLLYLASQSFVTDEF